MIISLCQGCNERAVVDLCESDEWLCENCEWNKAEAAYMRQQERLMEDGPGPTLLDQQKAAMVFK